MTIWRILTRAVLACCALACIAALAAFALHWLHLREREADAPLQARKIAWCEEASTLAAELALAEEEDPAAADRLRALRLGPMGLMDSPRAADAIVAFDGLLKARAAMPAAGDALPAAAAGIAEACRAELSPPSPFAALPGGR